MTSSPANWTGLFRPQDEPELEIIIDEEEVEITEVTADMLMEMPEGDDLDDLDDYEDVTEELEPLDALPAPDPDPEEPSQAEDWPRSYEEHLHHLRRATRDKDAAQALAIFGMGDIDGCEETAAAIAKTWSDLRFWEPMLEMGRAGDFMGHLGDLRKCMALLEAHPPPPDHHELLASWEEARGELRRNVPGAQSAAAGDLQWQQRVARGRQARVTILEEEVA
jgi:hypothetical protein